MWVRPKISFCFSYIDSRRLSFATDTSRTTNHLINKWFLIILTKYHVYISYFNDSKGMFLWLLVFQIY